MDGPCPPAQGLEPPTVKRSMLAIPGTSLDHPCTATTTTRAMREPPLPNAALDNASDSFGLLSGRSRVDVCVCVLARRQVWGHAWDNIDARVADVLETLNNPDGVSLVTNREPHSHSSKNSTLKSHRHAS